MTITATVAPCVPVTLYSTCPPSSDSAGGPAYLAEVARVARWSEEQGCEGILVYTDNRLVDPWLVAQAIIQSTNRLAPLVAVQPIYMHPYSIAKMVASLGHLYGRRVALNLVAGGFTTDLQALNDPTPHDRRYDRLVEYATIVNRLLAGGPVTFEGEFYTVRNLTLSPILSPDLFPTVFISGSSPAGMAAARAIGATAVQYPEPPDKAMAVAEDGQRSGVRIGVIARPDADEAWTVAHTRFPEDRKGQLTHQLAMKVSDSSWHKQLTAIGRQPHDPENGYWLVPFQNYKTFCPYLVGSYERVARELRRYMDCGHGAFILDIPPDKDELEHTGAVFALAQAMRQPESEWIETNA